MTESHKNLRGLAELGHRVCATLGTGFVEPRNKESTTPPHGFTLIELLVVIAVIAILAALLLPALSRAKMSAENTVCRNNLRQQAIGLGMYVGDFGKYPLGVTQPLGTQSNALWMQKLEPYVGDKWSPDTSAWGSGRANGVNPRGVYSCPAYNRVGGMYWTRGMITVGAYGYNAHSAQLGGPVVGRNFFTFPIGDGGDGRPVSETAVLRPGLTIAIGDAQMVPLVNPGEPLTPGEITGMFIAPFPQNGLIAVEVYPEIGARLGPLKAALRRHGGWWNMVFCDGHVEQGRTKKFFDFDDDEVIKRWSRDNKPHRYGQ